MGLNLEYGPGQTPLSEQEKDGLRIKTITNREELDEHEQRNIEKAIEWTIHRNLSLSKVLSEPFIKELHKKMFSDVWNWAGTFRLSERNIGVPWIKIGVELKYLLDDTKHWIKNDTYMPDEVAIRFKHRLVSIHCFPNGNGRHSRIMADTIIESIFNKKVFTWHGSNMTKPDETRQQYISALRKADSGLIDPLIEFARS